MADLIDVATSQGGEVAFSPALDLREAFWKMKRARIRVTPTHTTRASSIGDPCERRLFYGRTASELARPHPPELQAIFDLGRELEKFVVHEIEEMGADVVQRERDYLDRDLELSAHSDAKVRMRGWPRALTAEIKGLNPYTAESIETIEDIRESRQHWVRKYYDQLQSYLYFDQADAGVFVLLNKVSGQIEFIDCPRDQVRIDELLAKAARIRDAVRANEPPPRTEGEDCGRCAFQHVCQPARSFGASVQVFDSEEAEALIDRQLKKILPSVPELLVGGYAVVAKEVRREGYAIAPSTYWQRKFVPISNGGIPQ